MIPYWKYLAQSSAAKEDGETRVRPATFELAFWTRFTCWLTVLLHMTSVTAPLAISFSTTDRYSHALAVFHGVIVSLVLILDVNLMGRLSRLFETAQTSIPPLCVLSSLLSTGFVLVYYIYRKDAIHCGSGYTEYSCVGTWIDSTTPNYQVCKVNPATAQAEFLSNSVTQPNSEYKCWESIAAFDEYTLLPSNARICSGAWTASNTGLCYCFGHAGRACTEPIKPIFLEIQLFFDVIMGWAFVIAAAFNWGIRAIPGGLYNQVFKPLLAIPDYHQMVVLPFAWEISITAVFAAASIWAAEGSIPPIAAFSITAEMTVLAIGKATHLSYVLHIYRAQGWTEHQLFVDAVRGRYLPLWEGLSFLGHILPGFGVGMALIGLNWLKRGCWFGIGVVLLCIPRATRFLRGLTKACEDEQVPQVGGRISDLALSLEVAQAEAVQPPGATAAAGLLPISASAQPDQAVSTAWGNLKSKIRAARLLLPRSSSQGVAEVQKTDDTPQNILWRKSAMSSDRKSSARSTEQVDMTEEPNLPRQATNNAFAGW